MAELVPSASLWLSARSIPHTIDNRGEIRFKCPNCGGQVFVHRSGKMFFCLSNDYCPVEGEHFEAQMGKFLDPVKNASPQSPRTHLSDSSAVTIPGVSEGK